MPVDLNDILNRIGSSTGPGSTAAGKQEPSVFYRSKRQATGLARGATQEQVWTTPWGAPVMGAVKGREVAKNPATGESIRGSKYRTEKVDDAKPLSVAKQDFYTWTDSQRRKWAEHLVNLGLISPEDVDDFETLRDAWEALTEESAKFYMNGQGKQVSPWKAAEILAGPQSQRDARKAKFTERAQEDVPFTGAKSHTSTSVDLTDPDTAKALVNGVLSSALGRAARPDELVEFTRILQSADRLNPRVTTTTQNYVAGEQVSSSSVASGGLSNAAREQMILDEAEEKPDYGAYQAGTYYFNALLGALDSPV